MEEGRGGAVEVIVSRGIDRGIDQLRRAKRREREREGERGFISIQRNFSFRILFFFFSERSFENTRGFEFKRRILEISKRAS